MNAAQKQLMALAALMALQLCLYVVAYFVNFPASGRFGGDFICFWQAAQNFVQGDVAAIYDTSHLAEAHHGVMTTYLYPPHFLPFISPLGYLSYNQAVALWSLLPLPFYFMLAALLMRRAAQDLYTASAPPYFLLFALLLPFVSANIFSGQSGMIIAVLFMAAVYWWKQKPVLAGICIGLMTVKPQLGLLLPVALIAAGRWRIFISAAVTTLGLLAVATLVLGATIWQDYLNMLNAFSQFMGRTPWGVWLALAPYISLQGAGLGLFWPGVIQAVISVCVIALMIGLFRNKKAKDDVRFGLLACGTVLATPYTLCYDSPLLALALMPLLLRLWADARASMLEMAGVAAIVFMPYGQPLLSDYHVPFGFIATGLFFVALYRRYRMELAA